GRQEGEIVEVFRGRDGDEALDLGAAHQELHADPGAIGDARDPAAAAFAVDGLEPVERRSRVGKLADTVIEHALAAAHAARIEAQYGKAAFHEHVEQVI